MEVLKSNIAAIEGEIIMIDNQPCLLDVSVAAFYGVETKYINQAVKRNPDKFPKGYVFEITAEETARYKKQTINSRSQIVTMNGKMEKGKNIKYGANIFTEKGLYMLATILKSERATQVTLNIIETFTNFRNITNDLIEASKINDNEKKIGFLTRSGENLINLLTKEMEMTTTNIKTTIKLDLGIFKIEKTIEKEEK